MRKDFKVPKSLESIFGLSKARLIADARGGFLQLRKVPGNRIRAAADYWQNRAGISVFTEFVNAAPVPDLRKEGEESIIPPECTDYIDDAIRDWSMRPEWDRQARGTMFLRKGQLAAHLREGATDEDLRRYGERELIRWPTEGEIIQALGKHFEIRLLHRENSAEYRISQLHGTVSCETRVILNVDLKVLTYFHLLNDFQRSFALVDHTGDWDPPIWNLVNRENLADTVQILKGIIFDFEESVKHLPS